MKNASQVRIKEARELPLVTESTKEVDAKTGLVVNVTRHKRGVLGYETREWEGTNPSDFAIVLNELWGKEQESARKRYEDFCDNLRNRLEASGLPTDRNPLWISVNGGPWRPQEKGESMRPLSKMARWTARIEEMVEPASVLRYAAELLDIYQSLLRIEGIDEHLDLITQAVNTHFEYRLASKYNNAVTTGMKATRSRAQGPSTRRERGLKVRAAVQQQVAAYWRQNTRMRNDISNTAGHIAEDVNAQITREGLGKKLQPKTIGDHIRAVRSEVLSELANVDA